MELYDRNNIWLGLTIGLLTPIAGFGLIYLIFELLTSLNILDTASESRMRTIQIMAVCTNIFWIRKFNQPFTINTLRGIVMATMLCCAIWFAFYYKTLYA